jgi:hypothetical protein
MNEGLQTIGSATRFAEYVEGTYRPTVLPPMATTPQDINRLHALKPQFTANLLERVWDVRQPGDSPHLLISRHGIAGVGFRFTISFL